MTTITEDDVRHELLYVFDPDLMVSIIDLGLISRISISRDSIEVDYTLTSPFCPSGPYIEEEIRKAVGKVAHPRKPVVSLVWDPPWSQNRMTEEARLQLGYPI